MQKAWAAQPPPAHPHQGSELLPPQGPVGMAPLIHMEKLRLLSLLWVPEKPLPPLSLWPGEGREEMEVGSICFSSTKELISLGK